MTFKVMPNVQSREEFVALFDAITAAVPDDSERETEMFTAFIACADRLMADMPPEELERMLSALSVSLGKIQRRKKREQ